MASIQSHSDVPPAALAANWPPEILQEYLAGLQRDKESGIDEDDEDEATFSDSDESDVDDGTSVTSDDEEEATLSESDGSDIEDDTSVTSDISEYYTSFGQRPEDIDSDDSAFSSDDEFADGADTRMRRTLVLEEMPPELDDMGLKDLVAMVESYVQELDDADIELAEVTGEPVQSTLHGQDALEDDASEDDASELWEEDLEHLEYLRTRSRDEWFDQKPKDVMWSLPILAQALFRKERLIKRARKGKAWTVAR
jgi:hypothetical protein